MSKWLALVAVAGAMISAVDPAEAGWRRCCRGGFRGGYGGYGGGYYGGQVYSGGSGCCASNYGGQAYWNNGQMVYGQGYGQPYSAAYPPNEGQINQPEPPMQHVQPGQPIQTYGTEAAPRPIDQQPQQFQQQRQFQQQQVQPQQPGQPRQLQQQAPPPRDAQPRREEDRERDDDAAPRPKQDKDKDNDDDAPKPNT